jgi:hypothetical protein
VALIRNWSTYNGHEHQGVIPGKLPPSDRVDSAEVAQSDHEIRSALEAPDLTDEPIRFFLWGTHCFEVCGTNERQKGRERAMREQLRVKEERAQ